MAIMERRSLCFCCFLYFLDIMCIAEAYSYGTGGQQEYSNVVSTEQQVLAMQPMPGAVRPWTEDIEFMKNPPVMRPYHVFPMFQHVPAPLVDMELFRPFPGRRQLPNLLTSLLIPQLNPQLTKVSPVRNARGVEVWCGYSKISVRINKNLLGFKSSPSSFHLGTCPVSRSDKLFLYFHYNLNDCDSSLTMLNGKIMYSNTLHFTPKPQGAVIRAVPLTLNIQCLYNRFHYSYKIGFLPVPRERMFHKIFERRAKFSISVCNERWEELEENRSFVLGEPMYFEVSAAHTSKDERIFVDSCYATASKDPKSTPQHNVIYNYGCMEDSRRQGSLSCFFQRQSNIIRFSVDAFLLPQVTGTQFYLHCTISVHNSTSPTAKSCTYNNKERRWDELYTDASVCACCDSTCEIKATSSLPQVTQSLITSLPWIWDKGARSFSKTKEELVGVQEYTEEVKSAKGIGEEEEDGYAVDDVTDTEKQMESKEENGNMPMKDLDEDVEVIVGTETDVELNDEGDRSGKVMSVGEQMDKIVEFKEDAGRLKSTEGIGEEGEDCYTVDNVTDTEKQMKSKEENGKMPMKALDENVEVIVGTEETTDEELNDEGDPSEKVMSVGEQMERVVEFEEDAGRLKSTEGIGEEEEGGNTVEIMSETQKQMKAKKENEKIPIKNLDEDLDVIAGAKETANSAIELKDDEGDHSKKEMFVGEQMERVVEFEDDAGRTKQSSVHLIGELLEDSNEDKGSSESGQNELLDITREEPSKNKMQPDGFEKNMHVQSTVPSHMVIDEEIFLNAEQEPMEWTKMNINLTSEEQMGD
ncbi:zona pellucida glycoprotein 3d tandem duplicate 1 [Pseudorasbora parva]|uniref:zona pellucida glycoprotein 3d tandem duplicate 1 n=1 Tax=Pseudorasbora parva TaxID=51549 RepID=UPI00351F099D